METKEQIADWIAKRRRFVERLPPESLEAQKKQDETVRWLMIYDTLCTENEALRTELVEVKAKVLALETDCETYASAHERVFQEAEALRTAWTSLCQSIDRAVRFHPTDCDCDVCGLYLSKQGARVALDRLTSSAPGERT